ncbi:MAG: DUF721 domain-containing protein [Bacteroidales bacterium]|nr:DUF721 domain-containing protein [Bacteroidales bacterium]
MSDFGKIKGVPRKEALGMDQVIPLFVRSRGLSAALNTRRVFSAWDEVSGVKDFTLRKFYRDGKLFVTLSSSMVRTHLEFQKDSILRSLNSFLEKDSLFDKSCEKVGLVKDIILK